MDYENYTVEDFLADESFQKHCAGTSEQATFFWVNQLEKLPEIKGRFAEAVEWFQLLNLGQGNLQQQRGRLKQRIENEAGKMTRSRDKGPERESEKTNLREKPAGRIWWAAAVIILLLSVSAYFIINNLAGEKKNLVNTNSIAPYSNDVSPGGDKAILTLGDGSQIVLDSASDGMLTQQGNTRILKMNNGRLAYQLSSVNSKPLAVQYNTVSTPRGGQYQVVLPDGSKVWLNSASSLRFPTDFIGSERRVEITGEVYFEIAPFSAPNKVGKQPFIVSILPADGQPAVSEVEALGTHFNINAYNDEPLIKTTLLEGSVKVTTLNNETTHLNDAPGQSETKSQKFLTPGQQAQSGAREELNVAGSVDITAVVAWKDGLFDFNDASISEIMRQLKRWYDVEIEYKSQIPSRLVAKISRDVPISQLLQLLEMTELVHFRIEGRKITVMK